MNLIDLLESPQLCPECGGPAFTDLLLAEKKDACYHKVRSRYKVWPSAYASGALVQCRKKGAANWGNKNESQEPGLSSINDDDWYEIDDQDKVYKQSPPSRYRPLFGTEIKLDNGHTVVRGMTLKARRLKQGKDQDVAEGYSLKKTSVNKYMEPGDPDEYEQDVNIKDTDYEIINNKTGQVVGTASWTTNDFFGPGALKITMRNGATRYLDIWEREKGNPQTAFNRFVKDPKTAKKYKEQGVAEATRPTLSQMYKVGWNDGVEDEFNEEYRNDPEYNRGFEDGLDHAIGPKGYGRSNPKRYKLDQGVAEGSDYTETKLGTVKANLMHTQEPTVQVQVFKHNTLRGDSYWVTKEVKKFKTMDQAQAYVDRINKQGVAEGAMKDLHIDLQDQQWDAIVGYVVDGLKNNMDIGRMELNLYQYAGQEMFDVDQELQNRGFRDLADLAAHIQQNNGRYVPPKDFDLGKGVAEGSGQDSFVQRLGRKLQQSGYTQTGPGTWSQGPDGREVSVTPLSNEQYGWELRRVNRRGKWYSGVDTSKAVVAIFKEFDIFSKHPVDEGVTEGSTDTIYPNATVIKSKNGRPVGEIYQDGNSWGCFHYRADRGYDMLDSREDAIEALKDLHQETGRSGPDYTIKGVAEVSRDTLKSYQQKVSADSMKHSADPTKRSQQKANRSVAGFAKAQNRLEQGVAEAFGPLPKDNKQIRLGRHTVDIKRVGLDKNYISFAWHDSQGQEHYEEVAVGDLGSYDDLIKRIKQEISYQERKYTDQVVAEGDDEKIGGRHDPDDFDDMVRRLKKLAGAGPMQTVWDPKKRVYRNMPTAVQPPKHNKGSQ